MTRDASRTSVPLVFKALLVLWVLPAPVELRAILGHRVRLGLLDLEVSKDLEDPLVVLEPVARLASAVPQVLGDLVASLDSEERLVPEDRLVLRATEVQLVLSAPKAPLVLSVFRARTVLMAPRAPADLVVSLAPRASWVARDLLVALARPVFGVPTVLSATKALSEPAVLQV